MLLIRDLSFRMAGTPLFDGASASIPAGHHIGLIGRNGSGKTTLFRLIRGDLSPDEGKITLPEATRIGGVEQEVPSGPVSLIDTVLAADRERAALLEEAASATDPSRIAEIQLRLADIGAGSAEARAASILAGLGFPQADQRRPCSDFSGGWRMRVALAAVLFAAPDLLLLDEPTNYLDLEGAIWLENYIARYPGTVILISHDRGFLNRAVTGILHLSERKLAFTRGGYDDFARARAARAALAEAGRKKQEAQRAHLQAFVDRFRAKASKARQAQSRLKALARLEPLAEVTAEGVAGFAFPAPEELSPPILRIDSASAGYNGRAVLKHLDFRIDQDDRIALLGANGQGKTTLARLIAGDLKPLAGTRQAAPKLRIGTFAQHQIEALDPEADAVTHLRRLRPGETTAKLRARLGAGGLPAFAHETRAAALSGGQKARLALLLATLDAPHLVVLDEPTNHLDIESRDALIAALTDYPGAVILISHDAHLVELVADRLWLVRDGRVRPFDGDMADYRALLLGPAAPAPAAPAKAATGARTPVPDRAAARARLRQAEDRVAKLEALARDIDTRLADPALYAKGEAEIRRWTAKRAEVTDGLARAEALWAEAQEAVDRLTDV